MSRYEYKMNGQCMPAELIESLERYESNRIKTGGFLQACLENNLFKATARADHRNIHNFRVIVGWINTFLPPECYGDKEKVAAWLARQSTLDLNQDHEDTSD